jgi:hypothetical protein
VSDDYKRKLSGTPGCILPLVLVLALLSTAGAVVAQNPPPLDPSYGLKRTGEAIGGNFKYSDRPEENVNRIVGGIVRNILAFTGVIFMLFLVAAGDLWMTAGGNEEKIKKARDMIFNGVVGLAIVFAAYIGADFIVSVVLNVAGI